MLNRALVSRPLYPSLFPPPSINFLSLTLSPFQTRPQLKPGNRTLPSTISYISNSRGSPATKTNRDDSNISGHSIRCLPVVNLGAPATQGCSEDGPSSQVQHPWQDLKLRDEVIK